MFFVLFFSYKIKVFIQKQSGIFHIKPFPRRLRSSYHEHLARHRIWAPTFAPAECAFPSPPEDTSVGRSSRCLCQVQVVHSSHPPCSVGASTGRQVPFTVIYAMRETQNGHGRMAWALLAPEINDIRTVPLNFLKTI